MPSTKKAIEKNRKKNKREYTLSSKKTVKKKNDKNFFCEFPPLDTQNISLPVYLLADYHHHELFSDDKNLVLNHGNIF